MAYHILVVDDAPQLRSLLETILTEAGYTVSSAGSFAECLRCFTAQKMDAVLLDVMLPDGDGFALFDRLREIRRDVPVLFLSARDEDEARLRGLGLGADDYICKPFHPKELLLRLGAVLRRVYGSSPKEEVRIGERIIDWDAGQLHFNGETVSLTAKEYALLKKLWENRGRIVTVDSLCAALWDGPLVGYDNTLMVHIRRLREKIEPDPSHPQFLVTVRGLGYRLERGQ